jgi:hypothetical protein
VTIDTNTENILPDETQQQNGEVCNVQNENNSEMTQEVVAVVTNLLEDTEERNMIVESNTLETIEEVLDNVVVHPTIAPPAISPFVEAPAAVEAAPVVNEEAPAAVVNEEAPAAVEAAPVVNEEQQVETVKEFLPTIEEGVEHERTESHDSDKASKKKKRKGKK